MLSLREGSVMRVYGVGIEHILQWDGIIYECSVVGCLVTFLCDSVLSILRPGGIWSEERKGAQTPIAIPIGINPRRAFLFIPPFIQGENMDPSHVQGTSWSMTVLDTGNKLLKRNSSSNGVVPK